MLFEAIKETLSRGEAVKISGFGNFVVRDKKARVGRNPQTGRDIEISARRVLTFKPLYKLSHMVLWIWSSLNGRAFARIGG
jgi:nucleoid DNA-binding protein